MKDKSKQQYRVFLSDKVELALFKAALEFDGLAEGSDIEIGYIMENGYNYAEITLLNDSINDLMTAFYLPGPLSRWKGDLFEVRCK